MQLREKLAAFAVLATVAGSSFAVGPSAGDLSGLTPDTATVLTAIGAIGVVALGVTLAIRGFAIAKRMAKSVG